MDSCIEDDKPNQEIKGVFTNFRSKSLFLGLNYFLILLANLTGIVGVAKTTKLMSFFAASNWFELGTVIFILYCYTVVNYYRNYQREAAKVKTE